jgi:phosphate/sulfate permease
MILVFAPLLALVVAAAAFGLLYRHFLQPAVRVHFGEEHRGDRDPRRHRRAFERSLGSALTCFYFSSTVHAVGGVVEFVPAWCLWVGSGLLFLIGAAFVYAAIQRWRDPFAD